jgi:hypothetical protein
MRNIITCLTFILFLLSSCEEALERPLTGQKVRLLAPANNITTTDTTHTFYWEILEGASLYQLQVVAPKFDSIARLETDTLISINRFTLNLRKGNYEWRVKALNNSSHSNYSDTFYLTIQ